jgi:ferredoxin
MPYRVSVDKQACMGAGRCVSYAPAAFGFDEDDTSTPLETISTVPDEQILRAAELCPVSAISVFDEQGRELYPDE